MYPALEIAKWFVNSVDREVGESISHLKVQKLLYYAQGWHLVMHERPLFAEDIEAWAHGPVVPAVFHAFKEFGWDAIPPLPTDVEFDDDAREVLGQVIDIYGEFSAKRLEAMTHAERPWLAARGDLAPEARCDAVIGKDSMAAHFREEFAEFLDVEEAS